MRKNGFRWVTAVHGTLTHLIFVRLPSVDWHAHYFYSANCVPGVW
jgi:hypothetical protein